MTPTASRDALEGWIWAAVEQALWAGQLDHEFAVLIERELTHGYSPTDRTGHPLGTFPTLP
ncbi:hypothetical protein ITJ42_00015 [Clavibacter michiganensis subsp. phaseoli]|uniref:Uncharacterized protein n=1 Tax=Clavibacter phaseoli TaxID=1734031 RepID=A0A8I0VAT2_9MICO|nr:hypothetical protein [Clavibacter phaseoli]MBF4629597.1 hypothetical protein [Clavibacter phaseoli]